MTFLRGLVYVALLAFNVKMIARGSLPGAFLTGFGISYLWSANVKILSLSTRVDRASYALGAACGTVLGMWLGGVL